MTASLYVRTPTNSKPTKEATSVTTPSTCSSQRLLENILSQIERQEGLPYTLPEGNSRDEVVLFRDRSLSKGRLFGGNGSKSGAVRGLLLASSCNSTPLMAGEETSDGDVALLPRDCGRDDAEVSDEELVLSDGARSLGGVPRLADAAGSTIIGFAS